MLGSVYSGKSILEALNVLYYFWDQWEYKLDSDLPI